MEYRPARSSDAEKIAALHADSWRRHYRGAYADAFLDGDVLTDRIAVWTGRLAEPSANACTIVAEEGGELAGFVHTIFDEDATWGALLDNLHVSYARKRRGVGSELMALTGRRLSEREQATGLYLWVLEQNEDSQKFYAARGGRPVERAPVSPPGGVPGRLNGSPAKLRYVWPDPAVLLDGR